MKSIDAWELTFNEHFNFIGRDFHIDDDKASPKIFCTSRNNEGQMETIPFTRKLRQMSKENMSPQKYDKAMNKLINDGSIQYLEPCSSDIKVLTLKAIDDPEFAKEKGVEVGEKALIPEEVNYEMGFLASIWQSIKSWFVDSAKVEIKSREFLEKNPIRYENLQNEEIAHDELVRKRAALKSKSIDEIIKPISKTIENPVLDRDLMQKRIQKEKLFENRVISVFGTKPNNKYFPADGANPIDVKALPEIPNKVEKLNINEEGLAYLGLCMGIGKYSAEPASAYRLQETVVNKCLAGESDDITSKDFCDVVEAGRKDLALLTPDFVEDQPKQAIIGTQLRHGIQTINQMINTAHPLDIMNPSSNCYAAAKILKKVTNVLKDNPLLDKAVALTTQDEMLAKGGCEISDILSNSLRSQDNLMKYTNDPYGNSARVVFEAKLRGACAVNEIASYGADKLAKLKSVDSNMNFNDKMDLYEEIYPKKAANSIILKLAENKEYFNDGEPFTKLDNKLIHTDITEISSVLLNGIKTEAEIQAKNLINKMNVKDTKEKEESQEKSHEKSSPENNNSDKERNTF